MSDLRQQAIEDGGLIPFYYDPDTEEADGWMVNLEWLSKNADAIAEAVRPYPTEHDKEYVRRLVGVLSDG